MSGGDWLFYSLETGIVSAVGYKGPADHLPDETPPGMGACSAAVDRFTQRIDLATGHVIDYIPPAPADDPLYTWAWAADIKRWRKVPTLAAIKAAKRAEMKAARDARQAGGFTVAGSAFDSDADSRAAIQLNYVQAVAAKIDSLPFSVTWTLADDTDVVLSRAQMIAVGDGLQKMLDNAQTRYQARKAAIVAALDAAAVAAVVW